MNEFIEKNRRLLHFYCEALRTIGSLILILGLFSGCAMTTLVLLSKIGVRHAPKSFDMMIAWPSGFFKFIFFGIGIMGIAQFIRYLVERNYKPGWILRHGEIIFYLYALLTIFNDVWVYMANYHSPSLHTRVLVIFVTVFSTAVKVLILVGLGQILRRLMPVIEESRTLV